MNCNTPIIGYACDLGQWANNAPAAISEKVADKATDSIFTSFITWITDSANASLRLLFTAWERVPLNANTSMVAWLHGQLTPVIVVVTVISLLVGIAKVAISGRADAALNTGQAMLRLVVINGIGTVVVLSLVNYGDDIGSQLIKNAGAGSTCVATATQSCNQADLLTGAMSSAFAFTALQGFVAVLAIISTLLQTMLMLLRGPLLVLVLAIWPLTAAASVSGTGKQWFDKLTAWMLALALYKPVAAVVYALAIYMAGISKQPTTETDPLTALGGIMLVVAGIAVLPVLMRFLVPAVSAASGGSGAASTTATVATGAASLGAAMSSFRGNDKGRAGLKSDGQDGESGPTGSSSGGQSSPASSGASTSKGAASPGFAAAQAAAEGVQKGAQGAATAVMPDEERPRE